MEHADHVIAVSERTKQMLIEQYGIAEWKIDLVYNAIQPNFNHYHASHRLNSNDKIVLFLGRMTMQKGPDYFLKMAKKVLDHMHGVKFVMAGDGDMMQQVIHMAIDLGIEKNVLFSGFLQGEEIARAYGVPIIRRPELARTIYSTVEPGNPIPDTLYVAVAEILALVYRLRHKKTAFSV